MKVLKWSASFEINKELNHVNRFLKVDTPLEQSLQIP